MLSAADLGVYLKLQRFLLDQDDDLEVFRNLLPYIFEQITSIHLEISFLITAFLKDGYQFDKAYLSSKGMTLDGVQEVENRFSLDLIFNNKSSIEQELLWDKIVISDEVAKFLKAELAQNTNVISVVVAPVKVGKKIVGVLILGYNTKRDQIIKEDIDLIGLITSFVGIAYHLQDSRISLIKVGQDVYKMNAKLHDLDKLKDDFVSVASHELRTPMTAIKSYLWLALNKGDVKLSEKMSKYLTRGYISTERLINLVNDMLNVSRIEAGRIDIIPKIIDLGYLMEDIVAEIRPKADERSITVTIIKSQIPRVFADPDKVYQIVLNLLGNAVKFTPSGGNVTVSFFSDGKVVETDVKDSGVGISQEDISRLFQKFSRLDNSYVAAATSGGTGLGLFISKSLVEIMHGKIGVKSEGVGKGSTFYFTLPAATPEVVKNAAAFTIKVEGEAKQLEPTAL